MHVHVIYVQHGEIHYIEAHLAPLGRGLSSRAPEPNLLALPTIYIEGDIATEYKLSVDFKITLTQTRVFKNKITIL